MRERLTIFSIANEAKASGGGHVARHAAHTTATAAKRNIQGKCQRLRHALWCSQLCDQTRLTR
jgi:hypothetical protein